MAQQDQQAEDEQTTMEAVGIPTVNSSVDAPSMYIDLIQGAMVSDAVTKVFFVEEIIPFGHSGRGGRYVLNLTFPTSQLRAIGEAFVQLADANGK